MNDGSTIRNLQCVIDFEKIDEKVLRKIASGVALNVEGELVKSLGKGQDYELLVDKIKIIGKQFRETVLSMGGSQSPEEIFKSFRGRAAKTEALIRQSGLSNSHQELT